MFIIIISKDNLKVMYHAHDVILEYMMRIMWETKFTYEI